MSSSLHILLLEDDHDHVELFSANLARTSYRTARLGTFPRFSEGVAYAEAHAVDLVFLDLGLEDRSVDETIASLSALNMHAPTVVMTSLDHGPTMLELIDKGADDCLPKSELRPATLERVIRFALDRRGQRAFSEAIARSIPQPLVVRDDEGRIVMCNEGFEWLTGLDLARMRGRLVDDVAPPPLLRAFSELERVRGRLGRSPVSLQLADGRSVEGVLEERAFPGPTGEMAGRVATFVDLTESQRLQRGLLQTETQRFATLASITGSIAREFDGALRSVLAGVQSVSSRLPPNSAASEDLGGIEAMLDRSIDRAGHMLAFAGDDLGALEEIDLCKLARNAVDRIHAGSDPEISISFDADGPQWVRVDAARASLMIESVISNAVESIVAPPGEVRVTVGEVDLGDVTPGTSGALLRPGLYAQVLVEDNGSGMDRPTLDLVFEPFFTTKARGRGLGLPAALGIADRHRGTISLGSTVGEGTRCRVLLPRAPVARHRGAAPPPERP